MTASIQASTHQFKARGQPCGSVLPPMGACTVTAPADSALSIHSGRVWVTLDGPHAGPANDWGDRVLMAGQRLAMQAGERAVLQVFGDPAGQTATWCWEPTRGVRASAPGKAWVSSVAAFGRVAIRGLAGARRLG